MSGSEFWVLFDLDETLVFATEKALGRAPDFHVGPYAVYLRPGVRDFLSNCVDRFHVGIWTSSGEEYAQAVVARLFRDPTRLVLSWSRSRCTSRYHPEFQHTYWIKDLKKLKPLGIPLERVLIVDDSFEKAQRNYGNWVPVHPYEGDAEDRELGRLFPFLVHLGSVPNVRTVEKRGWQTWFRGPDASKA